MYIVNDDINVNQRVHLKPFSSTVCNVLCTCTCCTCSLWHCISSKLVGFKNTHLKKRSQIYYMYTYTYNVNVHVHVHVAYSACTCM